jgi:hypothetical protein
MDAEYSASGRGPFGKATKEVEVKKLALAALSAAALAVPGAALANNDGAVPADECSDNPKAVGQPFSPTGNAVDIGPSPVAAAASNFNSADLNQGFPVNQHDSTLPNSNGANGQDNSQAIDHCD